MREQESPRSDLMARAAWLHFVGGLTHAEVGKHLRIPSFKVQRLIAAATQSSLIRVFVNSPISECCRLEKELSSQFGLSECVVAPDLGPDVPSLRALATAGADMLFRMLETEEHAIIGLGHGRTLAAIVENLPRCSATKTAFVALLGGLTASFSADPYDVIHRITERAGSAGYFMPAPFFANSVKDRAVLLSQLGVIRAQEMAREATMLLIGIGTARADGFLARNHSIGNDDLRALERLGAQGEILGYFHNVAGQYVETDLSRRTLALDYKDLVGRNIVAAAGGAEKIDAILSILRSGLLSGLITDEATASGILRAHAAKAAKSQAKTQK